MAIVLTDFDGVTRPQGSAYDIGGYEFVGQGQNPTTLVLSPNGGENWGIGSAQTISWHSTGAVGNVDILLSRDGGSTFPTTITTNAPSTDDADNSFAWTVPGPKGPRCRIKVKSHSGTASDTSDSNFRIQ